MKFKYALSWGMLILGVFVLFSSYYLLNSGVVLKQSNSDLEMINLPAGFSITVFADNFMKSSLSYPGPNAGPRLMKYYNNTLYVTLTKQGTLIKIINNSIQSVFKNLQNPHGISFYNDWMYLAEEHQVTRYKDLNNDGNFDLESKQVIVSDLPSDGGHFTRTLLIHNNSLLVSVGSKCNACEEDNPYRASILKCDLKGEGCELFATGLRNTVGLTLSPDGLFYGSDNGRDLLGNDLPPDEINIIREGQDYGWPLCYGKQVMDTTISFTPLNFSCNQTVPSLVNLQAHSAPLGLDFYEENKFPEKYQGLLFVAYHGSWNRNPPTGYKIVTVNVSSGEVNDFATGWLRPDNTVIGRPVDVLVSKNGSLLISDDNSGKIYEITYTK